VRSTFDVTNATAAFVCTDGKAEAEVDPRDVPATLGGIQQGDVRVRLLNGGEQRAQPVMSSYRIDFRIADVAALSGVEAAFRDDILDAPLSVATIRSFLHDVRCVSEGRDYAEGLAAYIHGLLIKEGTAGSGVTVDYSEYPARFIEAHAKLWELRRPLARLICALVRLRSNDISGEYALTGNFDIDAASTMLKGPEAVVSAGGRTTQAEGKRLCPIDHGTSRVVALAGRLARADRWSTVLAEECRHVAESKWLDLGDRQKALAYWAVAAWRLGAKLEAYRPLTQIAAVYPFEQWATSCLEEIRQ